MHVAHIITRLIIGGAQENTLHNVEDQIRDYGDRVTLITGPGLGPEGSLEDRARASGADVRLLPQFRRNLHPWRDWSSYRDIVRLLRETKPDLVHTHASKAGILGRWAAAQLGIPAVHTIHGASFHYGQSWPSHRLYQTLERQAARSTARLISVADAMTEQYVAARVAPREKFVTISSGFDVEPFLNPPRSPLEVRRELGLEPEHVVIGKVARLFHLKGHEFVIEAAKPVLERFPNVRFLFVGDGILREQYERRLEELGIRERFVFAGLVPPQRVPELIHAMDIVVHTSLWEGLARVLPQGLIAGKPVVSYAIDGAGEVVIPGETGYLLPPQSVTELADALCELAGDSEMRARFGRTGRERFTEQFRHQTMTRRIREVYTDVLNASRERK
ncbi:MAG: glycosyl transferase family 1 [Planctomycetales bacterium 12-60-4]|nr:MAG: glycosyl transferase family 1 [Planctomycetales bacterium 12-60-4]